MLSFQKIIDVLPGLSAAVGVTVVAMLVERIETGLFGFPWVDGLVFAIVLGTLFHTVWGMPERLLPGVRFAAKTLLEIAIVMLGTSISASSFTSSGAALPVTVVGVVALSLTISYAIGRVLGLGDRLATLVACGNSICGNSAIVATAPVIDAESDDVAASIAFTAALGILVVLLLPATMTLLGLSQWQYGVVAGLTVYAVPQVLAATVPVGVVSTQIGTLVKLMRVLMLGPVILLMGYKGGKTRGCKTPISQMLPWFIVGFLVAMGARSLGIIPSRALEPLKSASTILTVISMAGLGLSVNLRSVLASGGRVLVAGTLSIAVLLALSIGAIHLLPAN